MPKSLRTADRHRGPSNTSTCGLGQLVDLRGPRTQARVTRDCWSTPRTIGPNAICQGKLVDTAGPRARARVPRDSWLNPQTLGHERKLPRRARRPCRPSDQGKSRPGQLVNTEGLLTGVPVTTESWSTPWPPNLGPSHVGQLVDPAGLRTQARVARKTWSPPRAIGPGPESAGQLFDTWALRNGPKSPVTAVQHRRHSDPGRCRWGQLVDTAGPRIWVHVARVSWSTLRAFGPLPKSPGTAGRPQDLGPEPESPRISG